MVCGVKHRVIRFNWSPLLLCVTLVLSNSAIRSVERFEVRGTSTAVVVEISCCSAVTPQQNNYSTSTRRSTGSLFHLFVIMPNFACPLFPYSRGSKCITSAGPRRAHSQHPAPPEHAPVHLVERAHVIAFGRGGGGVNYLRNV